MKKTYKAPTILVAQTSCTQLLAASLNGSTPTTGLDNPPGYGGDSEGPVEAGVKDGGWFEGDW